MPDRLRLWFNTMQEKWKNFEKTQKIKLIAITAGVLLSLIIVLVLFFRTTWVDTWNGVDAGGMAAIVDVLDDAGIRTQTDTNAGVVRVPQGDRDAALLAWQRSPMMFTPGITFNEVVDWSGMGTTSAMQHQMFMRARETEVRDIIMGSGRFNNAHVGLNVPQVPTFMQAQTPSTASVRLDAPGLTPEDAEGVAAMVANMVQGLSIENVTVTDGNFNILFRDGTPVAGGAGGISTAETFSHHLRELVRNNVLEIFGRTFGAVDVAAHLSIDFSTTESIIEEFTSPQGTGTLDGLTDEERILFRIALDPSGVAMGEPGLGTQGFDIPGHMFPGELPPGDLMALEYELERRHHQNMIRTFISAGTIPGILLEEHSSVAVMATNHIVHYEHVVRELGLLDEMTWLEFQAGIETTEIFEHPSHAEFLAMAQAATGLENVVIMFQNIHHFVDDMVTPLPTSLIILFSLVAIFLILLVLLLVRRTGTDNVEEIEPELSVEDLLVSSQLEDARENEMARLAEIKYAADSSVKEQIDKFAEEMPESVAQLLRNWINEDWE